jgi:uncharacterized protein YkwD
MREVTVRRRTTAVAVAAALTLGLGVVQAPPADAAFGRLEKRLLMIVNRTRERHDLRLLKMDRSLSRPSEKHTRKMINQDRLFDPPNLEEILEDYNWDDLGADVVGCGNTLKELHRILMTEDFHRTILLHPKLRRVGIGVVVADERNRCGRGSFWATEILYG